MNNPDAPLTAEVYRQLHDIADNPTLERLAAEHPNNQTTTPDDDPATDPDYVPNPPYDLPDGVTNWSAWCQ